jgi:hypothetical protein
MGQIHGTQAADSRVEIGVCAEIHDDEFGEPRVVTRAKAIVKIERWKRCADEIQE